MPRRWLAQLENVDPGWGDYGLENGLLFSGHPQDMYTNGTIQSRPRITIICNPLLHS